MGSLVNEFFSGKQKNMKGYKSLLTLTNLLAKEGLVYNASTGGSCTLLVNGHRVNLRNLALISYDNGKRAEKAYRCKLYNKGQKIGFYILHIENYFYILPARLFTKKSISISPQSLERYYKIYRNNWALLTEGILVV